MKLPKANLTSPDDGCNRVQMGKTKINFLTKIGDANPSRPGAQKNRDPVGTRFNRKIARTDLPSGSHPLDLLGKPGNLTGHGVAGENAFLRTAHHFRLGVAQGDLGFRFVAGGNRQFNFSDGGANRAQTAHIYGGLALGPANPFLGGKAMGHTKKNLLFTWRSEIEGSGVWKEKAGLYRGFGQPSRPCVLFVRPGLTPRGHQPEADRQNRRGSGGGIGPK